MSLRAWAWCGQHAALAAGRPEEELYCELLGDHAVFLRHNLEYDVGGNHLVKNLKGCSGWPCSSATWCVDAIRPA